MKFFTADKAATELGINKRYFRKLVEKLHIQAKSFPRHGEGAREKHFFTAEQVEQVRNRKSEAEPEVIRETENTMTFRIPLEPKTVSAFQVLCLHCPHALPHGQTRCCQCGNLLESAVA